MATARILVSFFLLVKFNMKVLLIEGLSMIYGLVHYYL
jgi:hypothetical protein